MRHPKKRLRLRGNDKRLQNQGRSLIVIYRRSSKIRIFGGSGECTSQTNKHTILSMLLSNGADANGSDTSAESH